MLALHEPTLTKQDEEYILEAIRSGWVSTAGPFVDRFEAELAAFVGARFAVSVANGTVGLQLVIECLKRKARHTGPFHVLVPALSFAATWNAVIHAGGIPVLVDVAPNTMNMSVASLARRFEEDYLFDKTKRSWTHRATAAELLAVLPAHIMGWTPQMNEIADLCSHHGISLIEDAAESLGCRNGVGTHVGLSGVASVFSFNGNKVMTTGGGGMIVSNDDDFARLARHLSTTAKTDSLRFEHDQLGYNFRLVNILAALGCSQLNGLNEALLKKRRIREWYRERVADQKAFRLHHEEGCISNNWINNLIFETRGLRESALARLLAEDIQCRPLWTPGHRLEYVRELQPGHVDFPNTEQMWHHALSLPSSAHIREKDVARVIGVIEDAVRG